MRNFSHNHSNMRADMLMCEIRDILMIWLGFSAEICTKLNEWG